jgi:hypothetical protein
MESSPDNGKTEISIAKIGLISALIVAACGLVGTLVTVFGGAIAAYYANQAAQAPIVIPLSATQTAEAKGGPSGGSPGSPAFLVKNHLLRPVRVFVNDAYIGEVDAGASLSFPLEKSPALARWEVVKETTDTGKPIGDDMAASNQELKAGATLEVTHIAGGQAFFYPYISNKTGQDCDITINKGWKDETVPGASVGANTDEVGVGYFKLFKNSNISLDCDGRIRYWGVLPDGKDDSSFFESVDAKSGELALTLKP